MEHTRRGALIYFHFFNKQPEYAANAPGRFFALFREEGPVGQAHDTRRCSKRTCCRSGKGRFAACSGRNSTGIFFSLRMYSLTQVVFFYFCVSTSVLNTSRSTKQTDVEAGNNYKREGKQEARATESGGNESKDHAEKTISETITHRKIPHPIQAPIFPSWKRPGARLLPYFCSEKRPGYVRCKRPGGAISELFYGPPRGSFTPFFTVCE